MAQWLAIVDEFGPDAAVSASSFAGRGRQPGPPLLEHVSAGDEAAGPRAGDRRGEAFRAPERGVPEPGLRGSFAPWPSAPFAAQALADDLLLDVRDAATLHQRAHLAADRYAGAGELPGPPPPGSLDLQV